jgi:hypothetical protein
MIGTLPTDRLLDPPCLQTVSWTHPAYRPSPGPTLPTDRLLDPPCLQIIFASKPFLGPTDHHQNRLWDEPRPSCAVPGVRKPGCDVEKSPK